MNPPVPQSEPPSANEPAPVVVNTTAPTIDPVEALLRLKMRRGLLVGSVSALAGLGAWWWVVTRSSEGSVPWPLRRVLDANGKIADATFRADRLAPQFDAKAARWPRANGDIGLDDPLDVAKWTLRTIGAGGEAAAKTFPLEAIRALPRFEMTTELKCIEGWSTVVGWAGARLSDFAAMTGLAARSGAAIDLAKRPGDLSAYVGMETPDGQYYVGLDMASALHPQTLLAYEMNGRPLLPEHGAPLRLVIPVKYGIKHLKRIGTIRFVDAKPADFWAERGYDWNSGH